MSESIVDVRPRAAAPAATFDKAREQYQSLVFAFVSRRISPVEEAQDLTAQVFVDAFRQWRRIRTSPKLYLLGIARKKVSDVLRRRKVHFSLREEDLKGSSFDEFVSCAEADAAYQIVMKLPADERDAILMQVLEEMPVEEIASVLGRSAIATNSLLQRARGRIRKMTAGQTHSGGSL